METKPSTLRSWTYAYTIMVLTVAIVLLPISVSAKQLSSEVKKELYRSHYINKFITKYDAEHIRPIIMAIKQVESGNCRERVGNDDPSWGCMQVQVPTALGVIRYWYERGVDITLVRAPVLLAWRLAVDDELNFEVAIAFVKLLSMKYNDELLVIVAYNKGESYVDGTLKRCKLEEKWRCLDLTYYKKIRKEMR